MLPLPQQQLVDKQGQVKAQHSTYFMYNIESKTCVCNFRLFINTFFQLSLHTYVICSRAALLQLPFACIYVETLLQYACNKRTAAEVPKEGSKEQYEAFLL